MRKMSLIETKNAFLQTVVLCVGRYLDCTLAGIGNNLFVYSNENLLLSKPIFVGERIHSIIIKKEVILLKGGRQLALVKLIKTSGELECSVLSKIETSDWIQAVVVCENLKAGLVTAHNSFEYWDLETEKKLNSCSCKENCILFSCSVVGETKEDLVVFSGTVFGVVLMWTPFLKENQILKSLKGHNGAVFSIAVKPEENLVTTTSDDRSLKIWSVISPKPLLHPSDWENSNILLVHTLFGHTARVWKSLILPSVFLTIGEDSQLIVWSRCGEVVRSLCLHQESGIRALDFSKEKSVITTGGEDGGVNGFSLQYLTSPNEGVRILNLGQSVSTKVCFSQTGIVYTLNGNCILVSDEGLEEVVYKSEKFSSYCVLEVSRGDDLILLGSIEGDLVVIDSSAKAVVAEEKVVDGRIYSIHWLGEFLLTCGPGGRLDMWELAEGVLKNTATMTLPECKERWTTCGAVRNDKLILGDRMGNLHVYQLPGGETPVKSFRKIHKYLGVTDIKVMGGSFYSIGRDGTVKEFAEDLNLSLTCRLPMEWPWKIVEHEGDVLILGFHSVSFIVWSTKNREVIARRECGGGHRSCDYKIDKNKLSFLYVKNKKVAVVELILNGVLRIRNGFHGKEINCLKRLQSDPTILVTGSEDTTVRISIIDNAELKSVIVLKTHVSSVRTICTCTTETGEVIVSGGGKGQIVVWDFDPRTLKCREVVDYRLIRETHGSKSSASSIDPDIRVMCVDIMKTEKGFFIAAGCSDCQLRMFSFDGVLNQIGAILLNHCILKVMLVSVNLRRLLVYAGTDGRVCFLDVTDCPPMKPLGRFSHHQSGINSIQLMEVEVGKFILATGGDDNLISVAVVQVEREYVQVTRVWESRTTHSCQVTGIIFQKNFFLTTSIDQRITLWKWSWREGEFQAEFLNQCLTSVPDVQGMDATWTNDSIVSVAVHGKGLEIVNFDMSST